MGDGEAAARAGGARVFGVGVTAERDGWATSSRLAALRLTFAYEEVVWARRLCASEVGAGGRGAGDERVQIRTDAIPPDLFAGVLNRGWELAEDHGRGRLYAAVIGLPDWTHYVAYLEGTAAAAAVLYRHHGVAVCVIAATIPAFRGRGLQTALITRRLDDAVAAGCDLATVETVADNASPATSGGPASWCCTAAASTPKRYRDPLAMNGSVGGRRWAGGCWTASRPERRRTGVRARMIRNGNGMPGRTVHRPCRAGTGRRNGRLVGSGRWGRGLAGSWKLTADR